jgi:hypothetical protein
LLKGRRKCVDNTYAGQIGQHRARRPAVTETKIETEIDTRLGALTAASATQLLYTKALLVLLMAVAVMLLSMASTGPVGSVSASATALACPAAGPLCGGEASTGGSGTTGGASIGGSAGTVGGEGGDLGSVGSGGSGGSDADAVCVTPLDCSITGSGGAGPLPITAGPVTGHVGSGSGALAEPATR